eukprot:180913_1
MTGTEGRLVFGAKLSSFVAAACSELGDTKGLYDIFKHASKKAESAMGLTLQEHDWKVDDVIFQIKPQSRGPASRGGVDLTCKTWMISSQNATELIDFARVLFGFLRNSLKLELSQEEALKYIFNHISKATNK